MEISQEDIPVLSPKRWVRMLPGIWGYEIKFFNDGTFDAFFLAEPTVKCTKGRFIQNLNKVSLFSEFKGIIEFGKDRSWCRKIRKDEENWYAEYDRHPDKDFRHLECIYRNDPEGIIYKKHLYCSPTIRVSDPDTKFKPGDILNINGVPSISELSEGRTITGVRIREKPDLTAKILNYWGKSYLPSGAQIKIYAFKTEPDTIDGLTGNWKYISADQDVYWIYGWTFGPYIRKD